MESLSCMYMFDIFVEGKTRKLSKSDYGTFLFPSILRQDNFYSAQLLHVALT